MTIATKTRKEISQFKKSPLLIQFVKFVINIFVHDCSCHYSEHLARVTMIKRQRFKLKTFEYPRVQNERGVLEGRVGKTGESDCKTQQEQLNQRFNRSGLCGKVNYKHKNGNYYCLFISSYMSVNSFLLLHYICLGIYFETPVF